VASRLVCERREQPGGELVFLILNAAFYVGFQRICMLGETKKQEEKIFHEDLFITLWEVSWNKVNLYIYQKNTLFLLRKIYSYIIGYLKW